MSATSAAYDSDTRPDRRALGCFLADVRRGTPRRTLPPTGASQRSPADDWATQAQVAQALGISPNYLSLIELGKVTPTAKLVRAIANVYAMSEEERTTLYWLALGLTPPQRIVPLLVTPELRRLVLDHTLPAFVCDALWRLHVVNEAALRIYPSWREYETEDINIIHQVVNNPMRGVLYDWEQTWALPMLGQLAAALLQYPEPYKTQLKMLRDRIRASNPDARRIWDTAKHVLHVHPDQLIRPMMLPGQGLTLVRMSVSTLEDYPGSRLTVLFPYQPETGPVTWPLPAEAGPQLGAPTCVKGPTPGRNASFPEHSGAASVWGVGWSAEMSAARL